MQPERLGTLTARLIRRTVLLSVVAVVAIVLAFFFGFTTIYTDARRIVDEEGADAALEFDLFWTEIQADLGSVADAMTLGNNADDSFRAALERHQEIFGLRLLEPDGTVLAQRRRGAVAEENSLTAQPWLDTVQQGEVYVGSVDFEEFGVPFVTMALPVRDAQGAFTATLVAQLDLTALWQRVIGLEVGERGYTYIVDQSGQLLVYSDLQLVRTGFNTAQDLDMQPDEINEAGPLGLGLVKMYEGLEGERVVGASQALRIVPWYAVVELPINELLTDSIPLILFLFIALVFTLALVFTTVHFIRRRVALPLRAIISGTQILASGDLSHRIVTSGAQHELLDLANMLNQMAEDLSQANRFLEARVEARTRDLQLASRVSEQIATLLDPDELLTQMVNLTKESFNLYHAHIYLTDTDQRALILRAGAGEVGRMMRDRGHRIPVSAELSLVARALRSRIPVIVADTSQEPTFLPNPLLPHTRSEAALPLLVGERAVGVLDVQSEQPGRFDEDLLSVLSTMARQMAVAINNANLFSETERTARHEHVLSTVTQAIQGATNMDEVLQVATRELGKALRVPKTVIQLRVEHDAAAAAESQSVK